MFYVAAGSIGSDFEIPATYDRSQSISWACAKVLDSFLRTCAEKKLDPLIFLGRTQVFHVPPGGASNDPLRDKDIVGWKARAI